jgi:hypothetical protein
VKIIRRFLTCLVVAVVLGAVLVLCAIAPTVQTWVAQRALSDRAGLHGSLESLSAGFGELDVEGLHLESDGVVLTLPSLQAKLPITDAALRRKLGVRSLVAKGWTLELSHGHKAADSLAKSVDAAPGTVSAQELARVFAGILGGWELPFDGSLDGVELEGDVMFSAPAGGTPLQFHVTVTGGGLSVGREGAFEFDAAVAGLGGLSAHGQLAVSMEHPRVVNRIGVKATFSGRRLTYQDLTLSAVVSKALGAAEETYTVDLGRGGRRILGVAGRFGAAARVLAGTWNVDLRDSDLAPLVPDLPLPTLSATGSGSFESDTAFERAHVLGSVVANAGRLSVLAAPLEGLGAVTLESRFDVTRSGRSIRFDSLRLALAGARPAAVIESRQPFDFDLDARDLKVAAPGAEWLGVSILGLPLRWLSGLTGGRKITGGDAAGEFSIRADDGVFSLRPKAPLTAPGVSVQSEDRTLARGVDVSLLVDGEYGPKGWHVHWAPLALDSAGRRLATIEGSASQLAGAGQPIAVAGKWRVDPGATASVQALPALGWMTGGSASGDFSASLGAARKLDATMLMADHAKGTTVTASVHATLSADGSLEFAAPIKIETGTSVSELSAEGSWVGDTSGNWIDAKLTSESVSIEHLRLLAAPLVAAGGAPSLPGLGDGPPAPSGARDTVPFWGDWTGHVSVSFDRLRTADRELNHVGGVFDIDRGSIHMDGGRGGFEGRLLTNVRGSVSFAPAAAFPYSVEAAAALDDVNAAPLFAAPKPGEDPLIEGRFSIQSKLAGNGINLDDLIARSHVEFRLSSTSGIIRLLKANVAVSIPEVSSPVSDTIGSVGYVVGSVLGVKKEDMSAGKSSVSKTGDAVLNFTYQISEIGFDKFAVTATRGSDGTVRLVDIEIAAPDEHLKGTGEIAYRKGVPLFKLPLSVKLQLSVHGSPAELLRDTGMLSSEKDAQGFPVLSEPVRFGGTLEHIDTSQWEATLDKAANRKPEAGKKGAEGTSPQVRRTVGGG